MANLKISELAAGTLPMSGTELVPVVQGAATVYLPASALTPADVVRDDDSRLSDSRTPTGGAGGVLSGSYPNPGFAVDMATQGELDAHTSNTSNPHAVTAAQAGADPAGTAVAALVAHEAAADPHTQYAKESDLGDSAALDVGTAAGTVAAGDDPRLSDSRPPTGGAGGVLSGTYPNPGFAVDMATQGELDAHAGNTSNPHAVTAAQAGADPAGTAGAEVAAHAAATDPHPQYTTAAEAVAHVVAERTASATLTNKTLTTPVINGFTGSTAEINIGSGQFVKNVSGNFGLGATPSPWGAGYKAIDIGGGVGIAGLSNAAYVTTNAYHDGTNYIYKASAAASLHLATSGQHQWYTAPSGIAGNPISFTQVMTLDASGNLTLSSGKSIINCGSGGIISNSSIGRSALAANTTGSSNTATGYDALRFNTTGDGNVANGYSALITNTAGSFNTATGVSALYSNTTGVNNVATGANALRLNTIGGNNTATGASALYANTTGGNNTANGYTTLSTNTTGANNTATGASALRLNTTGGNNTAAGYAAMYANTTGGNNTATGVSALYANTTGGNNTAAGVSALSVNTIGNYNLATGVSALHTNTTGSSNTANGYTTLRFNTTGGNNTATGASALYANTTGSSNTANGYAALYDVRPTSGVISAFADYSGTVANTVRATSTAHGLVGTVTRQITGTANYDGARSITVIDADSFYFTATWVSTQTGWWSIASEGINNTAIGYNTGRGITTGSGNTIVGANVSGLDANLTNNIILADGTGAIRVQIDSSGNLIQKVNTTAATLTTNSTLSFSVVDDTTLRISVRGADGVTRTATVALS